MTSSAGTERQPISARILVVDDEPKLVDLIRRALSEDGFEVDGVTEGARALRLIDSRSYDLLVVDLKMSGVDGITLLKHAVESRPELLILIVSAVADVESKVLCLELGAADYMTKPFALAELKARVWARLRSANLPAQSILQNNGLKLDLNRRVAETEIGAVDLSDREFRLLQHLMRHRGEVCSREELLEEVWRFPFNPGTNVVDVYVARLRSKLGRTAIVTVRNVGYYIPVA
jgi:DNA-binding response OmpR family regulator